jgi:phosphate transport system substrate-binding protein
MKKKHISLGLAAALMLALLTACSGKSFNKDSSINVLSREEGSGTRGAFIELFGIEVKNADGVKEDHTTEDAAITNSTAVMLSTVKDDMNAIGYISLGSLTTPSRRSRSTARPLGETIQSGDYKIARPFNVATKGEPSAPAADFLAYILSDDGQKVISDDGYISIGGTGAYSPASVSGTVVVAGSSSVSPVMEKLAEAYMKLNPDVTIELQTSDSTTGMTSAADGVCDIGMASRALKDSELEKGLTPTVIAMDGIAVIVSKDNPLEELTSEQVRQIFTGESTVWDEVIS